jgi:hypothetical protein
MVPFADPLAAKGLYNPSEPGLGFSSDTGGFVRDLGLFEFLGGARLLGFAAETLGDAGRAGNQIAKTLSKNNRYMRLGLARMGRGPMSPALRIGNFTSDVGRYLSHVDLVPDLRISPQFKSGLKFVAKKCGL